MYLSPIDINELATGSHDRTLKIWDVELLKSKMTLHGHDKGIWSVVYDNTGTMIATASPDTKVKLWDPKSGKMI